MTVITTRRSEGKMSTADVEVIKKELVDVNSFVRERFDPVSNEVGLLREETERLKTEVV